MLAISDKDDLLEVKTGQPEAMASRTGKPNPSTSEGKAKKSAWTKQARIWASVSEPSISTRSDRPTRWAKRMR